MPNLGKLFGRSRDFGVTPFWDLFLDTCRDRYTWIAADYPILGVQKGVHFGPFWDPRNPDFTLFRKKKVKKHDFRGRPGSGVRNHPI